MLQYRNVFGVCALVLLPVLAACSSGGSTGETETPAPAGGGGAAAAATGINVRFENYATNASTSVLFLVPEAGVRRQLGEVEAGRVMTLNNLQLPPGRYKFEAQGTSGTRSSGTFQVFANTRCIRWDMSQTNPLVSSSCS
jgi:hypothetical protein